MKTIPVELKTYNRRADSSVGFRSESLVEMSSQDIAEIDSHVGDVGFLVLTDSHNLEDVKVDDILENLPESDLYDNHKTPSQRLRNVLYVRLEQKLTRKPGREEFATYYKNNMESIINKLKEDLE
jgi:hypothetical protein